jgi:cytochrome c-type biogenesis protein CcmF
MSIAHLGMGLFVIGVTIVSAFGVESDRAMRTGETLEVAGLEFELRELRQVEGANYTAIEAVVEVRREGDFIATVRPQKRQYLVQKNWMTEAGIHPTWNKDLFVALGDQLGDGAWSVRIQYKPMIRFIWIGAFVMALGGLVAVSDRRRYRRADK